RPDTPAVGSRSARSCRWAKRASAASVSTNGSAAHRQKPDPHPPTEGESSLKRILYSLLVATLPFGSALAAEPKSKNAKVTLVYQHEMPNAPGTSINGVLVAYGRGAYSPGRTNAKYASFYATVLELARPCPTTSRHLPTH